MGYFTKRYHPPGTSPGTLYRHPEEAVVPLSIDIVDYTGKSIEEKGDVSVNDCRPYLERDTITWIHVKGNADVASLRELGHAFNLHPLALEDVINIGQRTKVDEYEDQLFIVSNLPVRNGDALCIEQISLFLGRNYIISFCECEDDPFELVRHRLRSHGGKIRDQGADYLLYTILDMIIDLGFPILEELGERIENLEDDLLDNPGRESLNRIHQLKRELLLLRRTLWPQREAINTLFRLEKTLIAEATIPYLRDCYDHSVLIMDLIENYREMASSMLDVYLSSVSYKLNDVMRVLTVIATLFIPPTFIVGVYGMNFNPNAGPLSMPELDAPYGYLAVWIVILSMIVGLLVFFRRKQWF